MAQQQFVHTRRTRERASGKDKALFGINQTADAKQFAEKMRYAAGTYIDLSKITPIRIKKQNRFTMEQLTAVHLYISGEITMPELLKKCKDKKPAAVYSKVCNEKKKLMPIEPQPKRFFDYLREFTLSIFKR